MKNQWPRGKYEKRKKGREKRRGGKGTEKIME